MRKRLRVLVTGVGGGAVGHQIIHALQVLGKKYDIVAGDADAFAFGLHCVKERHILPKATSPGYVDSLLKFAARKSIDVILPGLMTEGRLLSSHLDRFDKIGTTVIVDPEELMALCSDKWRLHLWLEENGFNPPAAALPADWRTLAKKTGYPLVGKPTTDTSGSRGLAILKDAGEVEQYVSAMGRSKFMLQEYTGDGDHEYTVGVLISRDHEIIDSIIIKRRLTGMTLGIRRAIAGKTFTLSTGYSQGYVIKDRRISGFCEKLALRIGARGPLNIQCRTERGRVKVFEVHPRFSGTTSLRADVGFNEPDILIRNFIRGERFGRIDYRSGVAVIRAFKSVVVPLPEMRSVPVWRGS